MGLFRFKKKKKKKTSVANVGDDTSQFTNETSRPTPLESQSETMRYEGPSLRKLKSPSERLQEARRQKALEEQKEDKSILSKLQVPAKSWLCRTKFFQDMCDSAFTLIDADDSGEVDEKELYSGLLLIHLKLGTYAGPAACRPLSRERCHTVFLKFDKDGSGYLDRNEFGNVMGVLFGNVLFRVVLQYCMTLMIVPFLAKVIVDGTIMGCESTWNFITNLDEHSSIANQIELVVEMIRDLICQLYRSITPGMIQKVGDTIVSLLAKVPESVWLSLPLTLTSAILGLLIVPRSIMMMDDFFQNLADKKSREV